MHPQLLLVESHRISVIPEKQRIFQQDDPRRIELEARVLREELVRENEKNHDVHEGALTAS